MTKHGGSNLRAGLFPAGLVASLVLLGLIMLVLASAPAGGSERSAGAVQAGQDDTNPGGTEGTPEPETTPGPDPGNGGGGDTGGSSDGDGLAEETWVQVTILVAVIGAVGAIVAALVSRSRHA